MNRQQQQRQQYSILILMILILLIMTMMMMMNVKGFNLIVRQQVIKSLRTTIHNNNNQMMMMMIGNIQLFQQQQQQQYHQRFTSQKLHLISSRSVSSRSISSVTSSSLQSQSQPEPQQSVSQQSSMQQTSLSEQQQQQQQSQQIVPYRLNLSTATYEEIESLIISLNIPKYRGQQIYHYIKEHGIIDINQMILLPKKVRQQLQTICISSSLILVQEQISKVDGTIKRVYQLPNTSANSNNTNINNQYIESVLMGPYNDGRYTACISSQIGCAQGCIFCATGQMGYIRQLSSNEIYEQVSLFYTELLYKQEKQEKHIENQDIDNKNEKDNSNKRNQLSKSKSKANTVTHGKTKRLSNVVFMGMGEPLANYKNVMIAVQRIINELGIGARRITISTVGIVPIIRKITADSCRRNNNNSNSNNDNDSSNENNYDNSENDNNTVLPQFRLAISLHSANDIERTKLLPANGRNGGLNALMEALKEYCDVTGRRITIEWALISGENDNIQTAQQLGRLLTRHPQYPLRPDLVHVNVIPLNPTALYNGQPSRTSSVNIFCQTLMNEFGISCTPRVRRGIDIDAGCGQLTTKFRQQQEQQEEETDGDSNKSSSSSTRTTISSSSESPSKSTATLRDFIPQKPVIGVYNDEDYNEDDIDDNDNDNYKDNYTITLNDKSNDPNHNQNDTLNDTSTTMSLSMAMDWKNNNVVNDKNDGNDSIENENKNDEVKQYKSEADRLISLIQGTTINLSDLK